MQAPRNQLDDVAEGYKREPLLPTRPTAEFCFTTNLVGAAPKMSAPHRSLENGPGSDFQGHKEEDSYFFLTITGFSLSYIPVQELLSPTRHATSLFTTISRLWSHLLGEEGNEEEGA
jgi:hypothetical protein